MATHSSTLAWKMPWAEEPGRLHSMGSQRVRHDWAINTHTHTHTGRIYSIPLKGSLWNQTHLAIFPPTLKKIKKKLRYSWFTDPFRFNSCLSYFSCSTNLNKATKLSKPSSLLKWVFFFFSDECDTVRYNKKYVWLLYSFWHRNS